MTSTSPTLSMSMSPSRPPTRRWLAAKSLDLASMSTCEGCMLLIAVF